MTGPFYVILMFCFAQFCRDGPSQSEIVLPLNLLERRSTPTTLPTLCTSASTRTSRTRNLCCKQEKPMCHCIYLRRPCIHESQVMFGVLPCSSHGLSLRVGSRVLRWYDTAVLRREELFLTKQHTRTINSVVAEHDLRSSDFFLSFRPHPAITSE